MAEAVQCGANRLSLRVENRGFKSYVYPSFHFDILQPGE
jgi:hypothetical protein